MKQPTQSSNTTGKNNCAIMQPTYLPWAGYFHILGRCDVMVFLDDVQFDRRSWQTRNRILLSGAEHMLTVSVKKKPRDTLIKDIELNYENGWWAKHFQTLVNAYTKAPFGRELIEGLRPIYEGPKPDKLARLNTSIIQLLAQKLGLEVQFHDASTLDCGGKRSAHLLQICDAVGATDYISPTGAKDYLAQDNFVQNSSGVQLHFSQFTPLTYSQQGTTQFVPYLSILDVIAHLGFDGTARYIR